MSAPSPDPVSPVTGNASPVTGNAHSVLHATQFGQHVPDADTSVENVSANPERELDKPVGTVYLGHDSSGREIHVIPQRRARMIDGTEHEYDHEARGMDTQFNAGHLRAHAHVLAANGDVLAANLMGDQRSPAARARGSASYRAAIDRAGHNTKHDK